MEVYIKEINLHIFDIQKILQHKIWYISACSFCLLNALIPPITKTILTIGWVDGLTSGGGISFIIWFALFIGFSLIFKGVKDGEVTFNEKVVCLLFMFVCLLPSALICWCSLFFLCAYLSYKNRHSPEFKAGFLILTVIALRIPLIQFCMSVFSAPLLEIDAFFVANFLSFFTDTASFSGNIVYTKNDYSLAIMTGCSSFDNMSLALLLWFTLVCSNHCLGDWNRIMHVAVLSVIILFTNTIRLSLMAWDKSFYQFFHGDVGLVLIELILLGTAILMALYTNENRREARC